MPSLKLKPSSSIRATHGHPWVYQADVQKPLSSEHDGHVVECRDARGYLLGSGLYNSRSRIIWRRFSRQKSELNESELAKLIHASVARRPFQTARRVVWSDADFLPGLVVDQYGSVLVVQTLTFGMEQRLDTIIPALKKELSPECIVVKNDAPIRQTEGLEENVFVADGSLPQEAWIGIGGIRFRIDYQGGQKTGFYLDQLDQHAKVASFAKGRRVLDACCNQGGFALHCKKAGAGYVLGLDISDEAIRIASENAAANGLDVKFQSANIFDYFHGKQGEPWGLIILDPPPFAKNKASIADASRGYKELNLRAIKSLSENGILATYCCSHHMTREIFGGIIAEAAWDAGRTVRIVETCSQPQDHPVLVGFPESEYLHGFILNIV